MDHLTKLPRLTSLELRGVDISDAGLAKLAKLTTLRELNLNHARFTDKGLAHLKGLPNLERLYLFRTRTSRRRRGHLSEIKSLRAVRLDYTSVTDKGIEALKVLPAIEEITLDSARHHRQGRGSARLHAYSEISRSLPYAHLRKGLEKLKDGAAERTILWDKDSALPIKEASVMPALSRRGAVLFPLAAVLRARNDAEWITQAWRTGRARCRGRDHRDPSREHLDQRHRDARAAGLRKPAAARPFAHAHLRRRPCCGSILPKNIRDLDLFYAEQITDLGMNAIKGWRNLKKLNVRGTRIADDTLEIVGELRQIEWLDIANTGSRPTTGSTASLRSPTSSISASAAAGSAQPRPALSDYSRRSNRSISADLAEPGAISATAVSVHCPRPSIAALSELKELHTMKLGHSEADAEALRKLAILPNVDKLGLEGCQGVDDKALEVLAAWSTPEVRRRSGDQSHRKGCGSVPRFTARREAARRTVRSRVRQERRVAASLRSGKYRVRDRARRPSSVR